MSFPKKFLSIRSSSRFATLNPIARDNNASLVAGENPSFTPAAVSAD